MTIPIYRPFVFLRSRKCAKKTDHVLTSIDFASAEVGKEETYECQECGKTKKIYELVSVAHYQIPAQYSTS